MNESGAVSIRFQLVPGLTTKQREAFMYELVSEDVHPDVIEVDEAGAGEVRYADLSPEDAEEAGEIRSWLGSHPLVLGVE